MSELSRSIAHFEILRDSVSTALHGLSLCCTPIQLLNHNDNDKVFSHGTGFYWKRKGQAYLITNWHVLSGINPFTNKNLSHTGFRPKKLKALTLNIEKESNEIRIKRKEINVLLDDSEIVQKLPIIEGAVVDIFPIAIPNESVNIEPSIFQTNVDNEITGFLNEYNLQSCETIVGDDCFILGYPLSRDLGGFLPIWKRGSIASELSITIENRPLFLVDAATTKGMSGAPIIRRTAPISVWNDEKKMSVTVQNYSFLGIYAGRQEDKQFESTNIGYGWHAALIEAVFKFIGY